MTAHALAAALSAVVVGFIDLNFSLRSLRPKPTRFYLQVCWTWSVLPPLAARLTFDIAAGILVYLSVGSPQKWASAASSGAIGALLLRSRVTFGGRRPARLRLAAPLPSPAT